MKDYAFAVAIVLAAIIIALGLYASSQSRRYEPVVTESPNGKKVVVAVDTQTGHVTIHRLTD